MASFNYLGMGGGGPFDPDQDQGPRNQQPYDPNNPNMSPTPYATPPPPGSQGAPGTGTTPAGNVPPPGSDDGFKYDMGQKPGSNALNYLASQLSSLSSAQAGSTKGGGVSGSSQAGAGLTSGEGKNQGGLMKLAGSIGMDM